MYEIEPKAEDFPDYSSLDSICSSKQWEDYVASNYVNEGIDWNLCYTKLDPVSFEQSHSKWEYGMTILGDFY